MNQMEDITQLIPAEETLKRAEEKSKDSPKKGVMTRALDAFRMACSRFGENRPFGKYGLP